jgi:hypothetical protein
MPERVALIMALILERPMCVSCIATKTGIGAAVELEAAFERINNVLELHRQHGRCRGCGLTTTVVSVERPE